MIRRRPSGSDARPTGSFRPGTSVSWKKRGKGLGGSERNHGRQRDDAGSELRQSHRGSLRRRGGCGVASPTRVGPASAGSYTTLARSAAVSRREAVSGAAMRPASWSPSSLDAPRTQWLTPGTLLCDRRSDGSSSFFRLGLNAKGRGKRRARLRRRRSRARSPGRQTGPRRGGPVDREAPDRERSVNEISRRCEKKLPASTRLADMHGGSAESAGETYAVTKRL